MMNNDLCLYGRLTAEATCCGCGNTEEVYIDVVQTQTLTDYTLSVDIFPEQITDELLKRGWKEAYDGRECGWKCPDCF